MKIFTKFVLVALALSVGTTQANAGSEREFADIYTDCGLGAMIAPSNDAVAAVTNVTWDLGTTASTSNISSPGTCTGGNEKMAGFIYETQELLFVDLAKGNGKYLDALASVSGVEADKKGDFIQSVRHDAGNFVQVGNFDEKTHFEKSQALYNIVLANLDSNS